MLNIKEYREKYPEISQQYPEDAKLASALYQSQVLNKNVIPSITPFEDWNKQFLAETPSMTFSDKAIQKVKQAGYEGAQIQTGVLESVQKMGINLKRGVEDIINAPQYYLGKAFGPTWVQEAIDRTELEKQAVREATDARVGTLFGLGDLVGGSNVKGKPENILELVKLQQEEGKYKGTLKDFLNDKEGLLTGRGRVRLDTLPDSYKEALLSNTIPDSERELSNFDVELVRPESSLGKTVSFVSKDIAPFMVELLGLKQGVVDKLLKAPKWLKSLDNKITDSLKASGKEGYLVQRAKGIGTSLQTSAREFPSLTIAGEIVGQTQLDPYQDRLANVIGDMVSKDEYFGDDIIEFLYTEETDSEVEARLKMALENVFVYGAASGVQAGLGATFQTAIGVLQTVKKGSQALKGQFGKRLGDEYVTNLTRIVDEEGNLTKEQAEEVLNLTQETPFRKFLNKIILPVFRQGAKSQRMFEGERQYITNKRAIEQETYNLTDALDQEIDQLLIKIESGVSIPGFNFKNKEEAWEYINTLITGDYRMFGVLTSKRFEAPVTQSAGFRKAISDLPESLKGNIIKSRNIVDDLSTRLLNSNVVNPEVKTIIEDGIGRYLNTSYKFFTNPNWEPSKEVQQRFINYLVRSKTVKNEIAAQDYINKLLKGREKDDLISTYSTTLKRLNDKLFIEKKELPKELQDFLGKINDANFNINNTVSKLAHWTQLDRMFANLKQSGENVLYYSDAQRKKLLDIASNPNTKEGLKARNILNNFTARLGGEPTSDTVPRFGELQGYWTTPTIQKSLSQTAGYQKTWYDSLKDNPLFGGWMSFRHAGNINNTVGNNITHERNFAAGPIFLAANGTVPSLAAMGESAKVIANNLFKVHGEKLDDYYIDLQKRGVINTSLVVGELKKTFDDLMQSKNGGTWIQAKYDKIIERGGFVGKTAKGVKTVKSIAIDKPVEAATKLYMAEDDFWKIIYYENQLQTLKKALPDVPEEVIKSRAAYIVKNTMPNYDLVSPFFQQLRVTPFGNFLSFRFEEIRTTFNMYAMALDEIASDNPQIQAMGMKRFAGANVIAGPIGIGTIGSETSKLLNGITDEQDLAIHELENEWSRYSSKFYSTDDKGNIYGVDATYTDPYTDIHRSMVRLAYDKMAGKIEGKEFQDSFTKVLIEEINQLINPFISTGISAQAINKALITRKDDFDRDLYTEEDPDSLIPIIFQSRENFKKFLTTLTSQTLVPGVFRNANRLIEAKKYEGVEKEYKYDLGTELLANTLGIRSKKIEPKKMFSRRVAYLNGVRSQSKVGFDRFISDGDKTPEELEKRYKQFLDKRMTIDAEIRMAVDAGYSLGLSYDTMEEELKSRNISKADRERFLLTSKYSPYILTPNDIDKILKNNPEIRKYNVGIGQTTLPTELRNNITKIHQEYYGKHLIRLPYYSKERKKAVEENVLSLYPVSEFYKDWAEEMELVEGKQKPRDNKYEGGEVQDEYPVPFVKKDPKDRESDDLGGASYQEQMDRLGFNRGSVVDINVIGDQTFRTYEDGSRVRGPNIIPEQGLKNVMPILEFLGGAGILKGGKAVKEIGEEVIEKASVPKTVYHGTTPMNRGITEIKSANLRLSSPNERLQSAIFTAKGKQDAFKYARYDDKNLFKIDMSDVSKLQNLLKVGKNQILNTSKPNKKLIKKLDNEIAKFSTANSKTVLGQDAKLKAKLLTDFKNQLGKDSYVSKVGPTVRDFLTQNNVRILKTNPTNYFIRNQGKGSLARGKMEDTYILLEDSVPIKL
jgi:hypothetical protein